MIIIAGPCQHESLEQSLTIANHCKKVCDKHGIDYYFKASFDKANRTSIHGKRGPGISETLPDFQKIKQEGFKILTDVHTEGHISRCKNVVFLACTLIIIPETITNIRILMGEKIGF